MDSQRTEESLGVCYEHYAKDCFLEDTKLASIAEDLENFDCSDNKPLGFVENLF